MLLTFILIIISIPSPPHSFIPGLKLSFSANPSHRSLPFLLEDWLRGFPGQFTDTSERIRFLRFSFPLFSCRFRAVDWADSCRLLSAYRVVCRERRRRRCTGWLHGGAQTLWSGWKIDAPLTDDPVASERRTSDKRMKRTTISNERRRRRRIWASCHVSIPRDPLMVAWLVAPVSATGNTWPPENSACSRYAIIIIVIIFVH